MAGNFVESQPATSSALNSSPLRTNFDALFDGDIKPLRVTAQSSPNMTVLVAGDQDRAYVSGNTTLDYAGGSSGTFTAPTTAGHKQIDILHIDNTGTISITSGTSTAGTPSPPTYPGDEMVLAEIYLRQGMSVIKDADDATNGYIFKDRTPIFNLGSPPSSLVPTGAILPFAGGGAQVPDDYLICDGTTGLNSVTDTSLADLYVIVQTRYGGTGADDFAVPDLRGRFPLGRDGMGGISANRVTLAEADTIGAGEGQEDLKQHNHAHSHNIESEGGSGAYKTNKIDISNHQPTTTILTTETDSTTAGTGTSNMNPFLTVNYIIKK
ncbi:MAG: tail fiber protein [Gammaproteobacteria bacterium]|nr:tail fiber protein [Gammaproteobacteria bacterium]